MYLYVLTAAKVYAMVEDKAVEMDALWHDFLNRVYWRRVRREIKLFRLPGAVLVFSCIGEQRKNRDLQVPSRKCKKKIS